LYGIGFGLEFKPSWTAANPNRDIDRNSGRNSYSNLYSSNRITHTYLDAHHDLDIYAHDYFCHSDYANPNAYFHLHRKSPTDFNEYTNTLFDAGKYGNFYADAKRYPVTRFMNPYPGLPYINW